MLEAYREAIATPYYLENCCGQSPFYYTPLGTSAPGELCDLAAYVDTGEARFGCVEYYLDGSLVGRSYRAPWEVTCRFPAKGGISTLEVRAVAPGGGVICRKEFKIFVPAWQPIRAEVNGAPLSFDVPPVIYNNRTMVPVRAIAESLGLSVRWKPEENSVVLSGQGREIVLRVDQRTALDNGREVSLPDAPPKLADGRVLVPLRWLAETLGLRVDWDGGQRLIRISR